MRALDLTFSEKGEADRPTLIIAHGLFGSGRNWGAVAKKLCATRHVVSVDMRNHAGSPWSEDHSYHAMAEDLAQIASRFSMPVEVLGHSMGGKAALVLAAQRPELVSHLIVADIAPVAYSHTQVHLIEAMEQLDLSQVSRRSDADEMLKPLVEDAPVRAFLLQSLEISETGARWRLNLQALRQNMPLILGFPDKCPSVKGQVSVLYGGLSDYVDETGKQAYARLCPQASFHPVERAGHWLHAENPAEFNRVLHSVLE
ncbi:MAG: alpha/beta fold hydrolase [Pseudomonadota bacterium]